MSKSSVAHLLLDGLIELGATHLFVLPGAHVGPLVEAGAADARYRLVTAAHELGAAYMADGYARLTHRPGVVVTLGGPGATNLVTAAVTARMDHVPVLYVTGDSPRAVASLGGFQTSSGAVWSASRIMHEATGCSVVLDDPACLSDALATVRARLAASSPVHLQVPTDVLRLDAVRSPTAGSDAFVPQLTEDPPRPLATGPAAVLVGGELTNPRQQRALLDVCQAFHLPVAATQSAKALLAGVSDDLRLGVYGYGGGPRAHAALLDPALTTLIVIGAALDERNTGLWDSRFFATGRRVVRLSAYRESSLPYDNVEEHFAEDPVALLEAMLSASPGPVRDRIAWMAAHRLTAERAPVPDDDSSAPAVALAHVIEGLRAAMSDTDALWVDSGEHRLFACMYFDVRQPGGFFTAAQTAPMGWAVAAAVGAASVDGAGTPWVLTGDGCLLMHGMELAIAARHQLRLVCVVSNNGHYGRTVRTHRHLPREQADSFTVLPRVDWVQWARALGLQALAVRTREELAPALRAASHGTGPWLLDVHTRINEPLPFAPASFSSTVPEFAMPSRRVDE